MRRNYEMTDEQLKDILEACKPVPYMIIGCVEPRGLQESANMAWEQLGEELRFDYMTVEPSPRGQKFFSAEELEDKNE